MCLCVCVCGSESVVLRGIFKLGKKSHDVLLTRTKLSWTPITPETPTGPSSCHGDTGCVEAVGAGRCFQTTRHTTTKHTHNQTCAYTVFYGRHGRSGQKITRRSSSTVFTDISWGLVGCFWHAVHKEELLDVLWCLLCLCWFRKFVVFLPGSTAVVTSVWVSDVIFLSFNDIQSHTVFIWEFEGSIPECPWGE